MAASEFTLIDAFTRQFPRAPSPRGPGDDCAVLPTRPGALCVTTDAVVENVHFTRERFSLEDVGHKALAVNLSDLASMGARPVWFVCALGLPREFSLAEARRLGKGMAALAREHRIELAGGNVTSARELSVTLTAAGEVAKGRALLRSGARPGDVLYVSGTLGDARLGLELLQQGAATRGSGAARRQRRPEPKVALGQLAARWARAAIDISDGLGQDLGHLCAASRVSAEVDLKRVPVSAEVLRYAGDPSRAALFAVVGGEDYELAIAVAPAKAKAFERASARLGERVTAIGRFGKGAGVVLRDARGKEFSPPGGFDHGLSAGGQASPRAHLTLRVGRAK